ncbi:MAG: ABC transporter ATP-binding protein [Bacillota bacterium]
MAAVLEFQNVTFGYANGNKRVDLFKDTNIAFEKGVFYSIIGPSGSGKTTALALAGALEVPQAGKVLFNGQDIRKIGLTRHRRKNVALVFQNYNLINYMTAVENVVMAMDIAGSYKGERKKSAYNLLSSLGLTEDEAKRNVMKLSGGQQQRVAIARALASDAEVILADEPTGNLDLETAKEIITIFEELAHVYNKCVIVVSHSHEVAEKTDQSYRFENGCLQF